MMSEIYEAYESKNYKLEIEYDEYSSSPLEDDNLGTMICFHRDYIILGDRHNYKSPKDFYKDVKKEDIFLELPLYIYEHGSITISTVPFCDSWDSSRLGFIYITKEKVKEEYGENISKNDIKEKLENEVNVYNQYLSGEVFLFTLYKRVNFKKVYENGREEASFEWEEDSSICGFYGSDFQENGLFDNVDIDVYKEFGIEKKEREVG